MKNSLRTLLVASFFIFFVGCGSTGTRVEELDKVTYETKSQSILEPKYEQKNEPRPESKPEPKPETSAQLNSTLTKPITKKEGIVINEFMASNPSTKMDTDFYKFSDWIEIYNNSSHTINIGGYKISTKEDELGWEIPSNTELSAHSFLIIWADKESKGLHSNFSLSKKKGSIYLKDKDGVLIDSITYKKQKSNISYGRDIDSFKWGYMIPTFKSKNTHSYSKDRPLEPVFSFEGGFYDSSVNIKITSPDGGSIYYTVDGSIPNKNSTIYKKDLKLKSTTTLRAIVYKKGQIPSKITTKTYFIKETSDLPVISISTNSEYLFDDYIGIYVEGKNGKTKEGHTGNYYQDWYRPVYFEFYDQVSNKELLSKNMEFGISGEASRYWNAKKSFKFKFDGSIDNIFYENKDISKLRDFKLRAGHRGFEIGDILANRLVEQGALDVDYQAYRAVNVYVNGELWGEYNIREKKTEKFIVSNYPDVDKNKLDIIKASIVKAGNIHEHNRMRDFIVLHDLGIDSNYQKAIQMIDVDNFIDYLCVMMYSANDDWVGSNNRIWRERKDGAKWRWMMDDIDRGFQLSNINKNMFDYVANYSADTLLKDMFNSFMKSPTFRAKFKKRYKVLLNSTLSKENIIVLSNEIQKKRVLLQKVDSKLIQKGLKDIKEI